MPLYFGAILLAALVSGCSTTPSFELFSSRAMDCPIGSIYGVSVKDLNEDDAYWTAICGVTTYVCSGRRMHYDPRELYGVQCYQARYWWNNFR
jgi:hypothetical protein